MKLQQIKNKNRVRYQLKGRLQVLKALWKDWNNPKDRIEGKETLEDYGFAFDYVKAGTFEGQTAGFFRHQLTHGSTNDEFRFYTDPDYHVVRIEYWFLEWYTAAAITLRSKNYKFVDELFSKFFVGTGRAAKAFAASSGSK